MCLNSTRQELNEEVIHVLSVLLILLLQVSAGLWKCSWPCVWRELSLRVCALKGG